MKRFGPALRGLLALFLGGIACAAPAPQDSVSGKRALQHVRGLVRMGARVPGSPAHKQARKYIASELRRAGGTVEEFDFTARTPRGNVPMKNVIGKFPGENPNDIVVIASHYDSLQKKGFVGANDGGSSTGLLLELARAFGRRENRLTVWLVFFDGEEAFVQWSATDSLYGSRAQAAQWRRDGTLRKIRALILLDMVGDRALNFSRDLNSTSWLTDLVWTVAKERGYGANFTENVIAMEDDHLPFIRAGIPAVDIIDYDFGPGNRYWHTPKDTMDKLSARSLQVVGNVVLETVRRLEQGPPPPSLSR